MKRKLGTTKKKGVIKRPARAPAAAKRPASKPTTCRSPGALKGGVHIWLVRHGETVNNVILADMRKELKDLPASEVTRRYELVRSEDAVLSELGKEQVRRLPEHPALASLLKSGRPVRIYTSPLRRAIETAGPLQKALPGAPIIALRSDLAEIGGLRTNAGDDVPGLTPAELSAAFQNLTLDTSELPAAGWWAGSPHEDSENKTGCSASWKRVARVAKWLRQLRPTTEAAAKDSTGKESNDVVIVGHGAMFDRLFGMLLGGPHRITVKHANTSVTHLELCGNFTKVHCVNALPTSVSTSAAHSAAVS